MGGLRSQRHHLMPVLSGVEQFDDSVNDEDDGADSRFIFDGGFRKLSKRSRAARRGEVTDDANAPIIATSTKESHENDGVRKSIIRTQIKNETLLNKKIEASRIRKQQQSDQKKKSSSLKHKVDRSDKLQGILASKIDASIARAKYVQNARKSNWDKTNSNIEIRNHMIEKEASGEGKELTQEEIDRMEEDEYVRNFYENDDDVKVDDKEKGGDSDEGDEKKALANNKFALLDEIEA
ncbi:ECM1 [Candida margitis]|uniref:ECM1 n=1 Tax=Candida margitis TaxID=1775924 RepID=UPI002226E1DA|nr:ECM1 [Candida margitis]KAI5955408.1 ECM1 [Candida margitis]